MSENKRKILVWPDGGWCSGHELEAQLMAGKSDDFAIIKVAADANWEEIDNIVQKREKLKKGATLD